MNADELYAMLKKSQEKKGYFFNRNKEMVTDLLQGLLTNKKRYGYMVCPCRLASEEKAYDKDIICPCDYREDDVNEFGSCYCKLYVSELMKNQDLSDLFVPERRPADKQPF